jgi:mannose-1-phosphate guanylyltransferase
MILAAGLGTRLRPVTSVLPKPLIPVVGVPNIIRIIDQLKAAGICEFVINTHHLSDVLIRTLGDGAKWNVQIEYSREDDELLGTGGGIKKALPILGDETFIVINGDALFAPEVGAIVKAHKDTGALATLVVREDPESEKYGAVGLDRNNRLQYLVWAGDEGLVHKRFMFTGMHIINPRLGEYLPDNGCIVRETYIPLLEKQAPLFGYPTGGYFCDLGTPERYIEANTALVTGKESIPGCDAGPNGTYIGKGVTVPSDCQLGPGTVICEGAKIANGVKMLRRVVVLPGAIVEQDQQDAIVTSRGEVLKG